MTETSGRGRVTPELLYDLTLAADPQIAPDGRLVAYVAQTIDRKASGYRSTIWVVATDGNSPPRRFTSGPERDTFPRWSPDGRWLAFLSKRGAKAQLWLLPTDGGEAQPITATRNGVTEFAWAPDSRRIAFVTRTGPADAREDAAKASGEPVSDERVITRLLHKADGEGFFEERHRHLWLVELGQPDASAATAGTAGGASPPRQLTDGAWDDYAPAFSPDGRRLAFVSTRPNPGDRPITDLYVLDLEAPGAEPLRLTRGRGPVGPPAWSPDGGRLAFAGAEELPPYGRTAITRLWTIAADGSADGAAHCPSGELDRPLNVVATTDVKAGTPEAAPIWSPDGRSLLAGVGDRGNAHLYRFEAESGAHAPVLAGERNVLACSASADGAWLAFVAGDLLNPADVFVARGDGGEECRLTRLNAAVLDGIELSRPERFTVRRPDGYEIEGWAMRPVPCETGRRYPAVLEIHGGPHAQYGTLFFHEFQVLAASGIGVIFTNPRGSEGYGQEFVFANHEDWGGRDMEDLLACVDAVVEQGWVDPQRLGVIGGSFGGFMTNWIIGHTDRFRAAVSDRSISNFVSKWGVADYGWLSNDWEWGGPPYADFDRYMRASPIFYVERVRTPLLLIHGEQDLRCPIAEAEQFFTALKRLGREVQLVRFPGEGHELSRSGKPVRRVKRLHFIRDWFVRHLVEGG